MSVKITGMNQLLSQLESRYGKSRTQAVADNALKQGAKVFVKELRSQFQSVNYKKYSKGYTVDEITISEPFTDNGNRTIKVYWKGPHNRYAIIHLNEWGTVKNPNPPARGVIARALQSSKSAYRKALVDALKRGM